MNHVILHIVYKNAMDYFKHVKTKKLLLNLLPDIMNDKNRDDVIVSIKCKIYNIYEKII